jgi:hypothetical protein
MLTSPEVTAPDRLADRVAGRVVHPSDPDWDAARQAFDLTVDLRPAAVAFPRDERDVAAIVDYAREHGLRIAPQATGHNAGPLGALDDTILVNVRELDSVSIDPHSLRVRVGAGVRWRDVVPRLSELGLAALHGSSPDVGIAGYSLGGGMGWLARRYGLQTNSVTAIELVSAGGRLIRADATSEPDLFWALRGGGGNFGVVTSIEFAVYPVEDLYAGVMFFPAERWGDVLHTWTAMLPDLPEELMTWVSLLHFPDMPDVPEPLRDRIFTVAFGAFLGDEVAGRALLRPLRDLGPSMDTFAMVPPAELADMAMDPREPLPFHSATGLLGELPPEGVDALVAATGGGPGTRLAMVQLRHLGGALGRPPAGAGARTGLPGEVCWFAGGLAFDEAGASASRRALADLSDALLPHRVGYYPNFVEEPADASEFFDPDPWVRLRRVKAAYDPGDLFMGNHHVPPADDAS